MRSIHLSSQNDSDYGFTRPNSKQHWLLFNIREKHYFSDRIIANVESGDDFYGSIKFSATNWESHSQWNAEIMNRRYKFDANTMFLYFFQSILGKSCALLFDIALIFAIPVNWIDWCGYRRRLMTRLYSIICTKFEDTVNVNRCAHIETASNKHAMDSTSLEANIGSLFAYQNPISRNDQTVIIMVKELTNAHSNAWASEERANQPTNQRMNGTMMIGAIARGNSRINCRKFIKNFLIKVMLFIEYLFVTFLTLCRRCMRGEHH